MHTKEPDGKESGTIFESGASSYASIESRVSSCASIEPRATKPRVSSFNAISMEYSAKDSNAKEFGSDASSSDVDMSSMESVAKEFGVASMAHSRRGGGGKVSRRVVMQAIKRAQSRRRATLMREIKCGRVQRWKQRGHRSAIKQGQRRPNKRSRRGTDNSFLCNHTSRTTRIDKPEGVHI